ncbi:hypothetical protein POM88_053858 [Heracleum sosnowskyi]|uniref:F-box domain-containing protein n=1 Tax=Heracleum sosnowskyi TaxID=360622 RepID=A0AAD8GPP5_9APIA|nr:hypothetical protein POM88_053858 [Heracleum sosnowskyi]
MDYRAALLKGLKVSPSLQKRQRPTPKINLQQMWSSLISQNPPADEWRPNLPPDIMVLIMQRIGWYDVLMNVKLVCKYWYVLSKDPSIWRVIEIRKDVSATKLREDMRILTYEEYVSQVPLARRAMLDYCKYHEYEAEVLQKSGEGLT